MWGRVIDTYMESPTLSLLGAPPDRDTSGGYVQDLITTKMRNGKLLCSQPAVVRTLRSLVSASTISELQMSAFATASSSLALRYLSSSLSCCLIPCQVTTSWPIDF
jgi:hypothetical protein